MEFFLFGLEQTLNFNNKVGQVCQRYVCIFPYVLN